MPVEITSRIRRDELLQILETEAPVSNQRTTAPMPAVTLTDLLCLREEELSQPRPLDDDRLAEPPPPVRRMRANTVPWPSRSPVRAVGTDTQIKALAPPEAAAQDAGVVAGRAPTADTAPIAAVSLEQAARELARLITPDAPAPVRPPNVFGVPILSIVPTASSAPVRAPALTTQQLSMVSLRPRRPLVIAASCLVTLVLALLISLL